jgi:phosphotransferase system enzyme I (PtsI)
LIIEPSETETALFKEREAAEQQSRTLLAARSGAPVCTRDGLSVAVYANIGRTEEGGAVLGQGADGVGLLRTEFLYMDRDGLPGEEEQFTAYKTIIQSLGGRPLTIRTLDIGGDKDFPALGLEKEENPFLGYRAIRISLCEREIFKTQLRAALRAAVFGPAEILFPMIISVDELRTATSLVRSCKEELEKAGVPYGSPALGVMIETPAAALLAPELAREADFFSLGTNDLTQYTLAVDRGNTRIAPLYRPLHPAVLRLIAGTCRAAAAAGIPVCICGELAGNGAALPLLLGLGLSKFSMAAPQIPLIKEKIKTLDTIACRTLAQKALACAGPEDVEVLLSKN